MENKSKLTKVYITKYALTSHIIITDLEVVYKNNIKDCAKGYLGKDYNFFYKNDFHLTHEEALIDCEKRRLKKINSLKKQIQLLEIIRF